MRGLHIAESPKLVCYPEKISLQWKPFFLVSNVAAWSSLSPYTKHQESVYVVMTTQMAVLFPNADHIISIGEKFGTE